MNTIYLKFKRYEELDIFNHVDVSKLLRHGYHQRPFSRHNAVQTRHN